MNSNGIILLNKRCGYTSFDELKTLKRQYGFTKIGHGGTLDKFAQGLLLVLVGYMTRFNQYLLPLRKTYTAEITFGEETDTLDPEGSVVHTGPVPEKQQVLSVLGNFTGIISQVPPVYSAVHVNGERAHRAVRSGRTVELAQREVTIYSLTMESWESPRAVCSVTCSKGTYIRSLARDIALACGSRGYVSNLKREAVGGYSCKDAVTLDMFDPSIHLLSPSDALSRVFSVDHAVIDDQYCKKVLCGQLPHEQWMYRYNKSEDNTAFLEALDREGRLLGWYIRQGEKLTSVYVNSGRSR